MLAGSAAYVRVVADGIHAGRKDRANRAFQIVCRQSPANLLGRNVGRLKHGDFETVKATFAEARQERETALIELSSPNQGIHGEFHFLFLVGFQTGRLPSSAQW